MKSVTAAIMRRSAAGSGAARVTTMSARLEDLKFMLSLGTVVLFGSGLDALLR